MTVEELIEKLEQLDMDAYIYFECDNALISITEIHEAKSERYSRVILF